MLENMDGTNKVYSNIFVGSYGDGSRPATNGINFNTNQSTVKVYFYNNTFIAHRSPLNTVRFKNSGTLYSVNNLGQASGISGTTLQWDWTKAAVDRNFFYNFGNCSSTYTGPNGACNIDPKFSSLYKQ